ncbi:hypothetical protein GCM10017771_18490 [Streptomyces capitiformicae]|uniref:Uncharacterized protein n=1 Tax=Streptomyces capitiformicae TaxID=2014920 RepID=A0A919GJB2_9ACTN|nr:hypothetical protein GCM10017771_18490 [Streptomyces capitiformicae]
MCGILRQHRDPLAQFRVIVDARQQHGTHGGRGLDSQHRVVSRKRGADHLDSPAGTSPDIDYRSGPRLHLLERFGQRRAKGLPRPGDHEVEVLGRAFVRIQHCNPPEAS